MQLKILSTGAEVAGTEKPSQTALLQTGFYRALCSRTRHDLCSQCLQVRVLCRFSQRQNFKTKTTTLFSRPRTY